MKKIIVVIYYISFHTLCLSSDTTHLRTHFNAILTTKDSRNFQHPDMLDQVASYIHMQFSKWGDSTVYQKFNADGREYRNVLTSFGPRNAERIIVGAHYDVCGNQDGADDNASGIVALLEFARILDTAELKYRIDLVAYSLEEPPYFGTKNMGSYVHANYLFENKIPVYGMVCLDMIGYYSDEKKSQSYPLGILKLFYGGKGDYLTSVRRFKSGKFAKRANHQLKKEEGFLEVKSFKGPAKLQGIAFSDHLNYWRFGYSALFITNTGFYRNPHYHQKTDELATLDFVRLGEAIDLIAKMLLSID